MAIHYLKKGIDELQRSEDNAKVKKTVEESPSRWIDQESFKDKDFFISY